MPVDSDERSAISTYFSNLDHLITLHQRELEETKTYEKNIGKTAADRDCPGTRITTKTASGVSCRQQDRGKMICRTTRFLTNAPSHRIGH